MHTDTNMNIRRGDVVLFSNLLFHSAGDNLSSSIRWSFDWRSVLRGLLGWICPCHDQLNLRAKKTDN